MEHSHRLFKPFSLNLHGILHEYTRPQVMGIINVTPDSFYSTSRASNEESIRAKTAEMLAQGTDMIDIGAYSSRPGADNVPAEEEMARLRTGMKAIRAIAPDIPVSVDTFRASVARVAIEELGADMINDISGGLLDPDMFQTVADLKVPYILMHMRGTPATMQQMTDYPGGNVTAGVMQELSGRMEKLVQLGVCDIIIDPGFGFSKTLEQNYDLLRNLGILHYFERPVLVGVSRKSMITRPLDITPDQALPGTVAVNTIALLQGAAILRVHDVEAARQAVAITELTIGQHPLLHQHLTMTPFGIKDALDIFIVALLLFYLYRLMKESGTINIFFGVLAFIVVWVVTSEILEMRLIGTILDKFMSIGLLVLVILFQDQIKRFLEELGSNQRWRFLKKLFHHHRNGGNGNDDSRRWVMPIVYACMNMSRSKTGALIVIEQGIPLESYEKTGDMIDATINSRLIENVFFKNSPLHDGAMIIAHDRIKAAGCILPVSHDTNVPRSLGLRHRSALGIAQATDALAIVVSEETGGISIAHRGALTTRLSSTELEHRLSQISINE